MRFSQVPLGESLPFSFSSREAGPGSSLDTWRLLSAYRASPESSGGHGASLSEKGFPIVADCRQDPPLCVS